jgi:hypothetical protein
VAPSAAETEAVKAVPARFSRSSVGVATVPLPVKADHPATVVRSMSCAVVPPVTAHISAFW